MANADVHALLKSMEPRKLLGGQSHAAAQRFAAVRDVLLEDRPFRLSDQQRRRLLDKPELVYSLMGEGKFDLQIF